MAESACQVARAKYDFCGLFIGYTSAPVPLGRLFFGLCKALRTRDRTARTDAVDAPLTVIALLKSTDDDARHLSKEKAPLSWPVNQATELLRLGGARCIGENQEI